MLINDIKAAARNCSNSNQNIPLSYNQFLEVSTKLLVGAGSWNHVTANPEKYSTSSTLTIEEAIRRLQLASNYIEELLLTNKYLAPADLVGYLRLSTWEVCGNLWMTIGKFENKTSSSLLNIFLSCQDVNKLSVPHTFENGKMISMMEAKSVPESYRLRTVLSTWFYQHNLKDYTGRLWDLFEVVASTITDNKQEQSLYGSICRESFNHDWELESMIALGLFDLPINSGESIKLFNKQCFRHQLEAIWDYEEPGMR